MVWMVRPRVSICMEGGRGRETKPCHDLCEGKDFCFWKAVAGNDNPLKKNINESLEARSRFGEDSARCQTRPFRRQDTYGLVLQALDPLEQLFTWMEVVISGEQELPMKEHKSSVSSSKRFQHPDTALSFLTRGSKVCIILCQVRS